MSVDDSLPAPALGDGPRRGLAARGLAALAQSGCPRLGMLATHRHTAASARAEIFAGTGRQPSAFAISSGLRFEAALTRDGAARILDLYTDDPHTAPLAGSKDLSCGAEPEDLAAAWDTCKTLVRAWLDCDPTDATVRVGLLLQALVPLELPSGSHWLKPDVLIPVITAGGQPGWRVGEIKAYLDQGGETDAHNVASAAAQTGVGVLAWRRILDGWGYEPTRIVGEADLLFQLPGWGRASKHTLDLTLELAGLQDTLAALTTAGTAKPQPPERMRLSVLASDHVYAASRCDGKCALDDVCRAQVAENAPAGTLHSGPGVEALAQLELDQQRVFAVADNAIPAQGNVEARAAALVSLGMTRARPWTVAPRPVQVTAADTTSDFASTVGSGDSADEW